MHDGSTMHDECAVAVFDNIQQVELALRILHRGNFPTKQISVVTKQLENHPAEIGEIKTGGDDSVRDAVVGAGLGGIGGALIGAAMSTVYGLGAVFFFGPLGLAMMGVVVGAFLGSMGGWGVHEERIQHYEELVKQGKLLLIAHGNPLEVIQAERMLKEADPLEVHAYAKTGSESPEVYDEDTSTIRPK